MTRFVIWRILQLPLILAVIYLVTFALAWLAPGSPFENNDRKLDPIAERELKQQFHADTWYEFLRFYPWQILRHGDLGPSLSYQGWTVNEVLKKSLPVSIALGLFAIEIALVFGAAIGTLAAIRQGGVLDYFSLAIALVGISIPSFVGAGLLLVVFSDTLHWLPSSGWNSFRQMILPGVALAMIPLAYITRLTRVSMMDTLGNDFVRTARAKGLPLRIVIWKHAFRNAFLPVFTYLGPAAAAAMTGSFVVEKVFNIPGLGQHFVNGVKDRDQTLILGTVMVYSAFLLTLNLLVDVGYAAIDPRIDIAAEAA